MRHCLKNNHILDCLFSKAFEAPLAVPVHSSRRLRAVRRRIAAGFYDRPDIISEIARRVLKDAGR